MRPLALITGAGGGMGAACARVLGRRYRLLLNARRPEQLAALASQLRDDGVQVMAEVTGDLAAPQTIESIGRSLDQYGPLNALVHAAGVSPSLGSWQTIVNVNIGATLNLLDAAEPRLAPGAAAVLISSVAAHMFPSTAEIDTMLDKVVAEDVASQLEAAIRACATSTDPHPLSESAYYISKYAVTRLAERRAQRWGELHARLVSVSPGMVATSMGHLEARETPDAAGLAERAPVGRWGTPLDIAEAVEFLLSGAASFISGCDLRVDGGLAAMLAQGSQPAAP
jgi:NAD(P)-dependent dehydrogenase (short-subunit alcohol dehydrogenase family)